MILVGLKMLKTHFKGIFWPINFFLIKKEFRLALVKTIKPQLIKGVT
jgi:hypothetical protein